MLTVNNSERVNSQDICMMCLCPIDSSSFKVHLTVYVPSAAKFLLPYATQQFLPPSLRLPLSPHHHPNPPLSLSLLLSQPP